MIDRRAFVAAIPLLAAASLPGGGRSSAHAAAMAKEIVTPRGIRLWLAEDRAAPLVALSFGMPGGSAQDPPGKEGLTAFTLAMLEEGAGDLGPRAFKQALKTTAAELSFSAARDRITGGLVALEKSLAQSADLLGLALTSPRFEPEAIDQVRRRMVSRLELAANDAGQVALDTWYTLAFPGHPYGRSASGTAATLAAVDRDDLVKHHRRLLARDGLRVVMVGSIGPADATALADRIFGGLPTKGSLADIAAVSPIAQSVRKIVEREQPSSAAVFGLAGRASTHADYATALVLNHIMGSGDFDARLVEEVRVKRGLTYAIRTSLVSDSAIAVMLGQLSTRNETMGEALGVIEAELARMARAGPTADEVANAKSYLAGSLLLGFDGSAKLAAGLLGLWLDGHDPSDLTRRREAIERVTVPGVARIAVELLRADRMLTVVVGRPVSGR